MGRGVGTGESHKANLRYFIKQCHEFNSTIIHGISSEHNITVILQHEISKTPRKSVAHLEGDIYWSSLENELDWKNKHTRPFEAGTKNYTKHLSMSRSLVLLYFRR